MSGGIVGEIQVVEQWSVNRRSVIAEISSEFLVDSCHFPFARHRRFFDLVSLPDHTALTGA